MTLADRECKPEAGAVAIHPFNNKVLNLPINVEAFLQQDFPHFSSLVELQYKYVLTNIEERKRNEIFSFIFCNQLSSAAATLSPNATE